MNDKTPFGSLMTAKIYVSDEGRVNCDEPGCPYPDFLDALPGRRHTLSDFIVALKSHLEGVPHA